MRWQSNLSASWAIGISLFFACSLGLLRIRFRPVTPARVFLLVGGGLGGVELGVGRMAGGSGTKRGVPATSPCSSETAGTGPISIWFSTVQTVRAGTWSGVQGLGGREPARCRCRTGEAQPGGASGVTGEPRHRAARRSQSGISDDGLSSMMSLEVVRGEGGGDLPRLSSLRWTLATSQDRERRSGQAARSRARLPEAGITAPSGRRWTRALSTFRASGLCCCNGLLFQATTPAPTLPCWRCRRPIHRPRVRTLPPPGAAGA